MQFPKRAASTSEGISAANYLKLSDGQSVTGVARGEIYKFYQRWPQGGQKEVFSVPTSGASLRYKINVVVPENGGFSAKVFEFGNKVYDQFAEIAENFEIENVKIKISRKGSGKSTDWFVLCLGPVDSKALKSIAAVELNALGPQEGVADMAGTNSDSGDIGF